MNNQPECVDPRVFVRDSSISPCGRMIATSEQPGFTCVSLFADAPIDPLVQFWNSVFKVGFMDYARGIFPMDGLGTPSKNKYPSLPEEIAEGDNDMCISWDAVNQKNVSLSHLQWFSGVWSFYLDIHPLGVVLNTLTIAQHISKTFRLNRFGFSIKTYAVPPDKEPPFSLGLVGFKHSHEDEYEWHMPDDATTRVFFVLRGEEFVKKIQDFQIKVFIRL